MLDVKLRCLDQDNLKRKLVAKNYIENIKNISIVLPNVPDWDSNVFHIFPIRTKDRKKLQDYLTSNGIQTLIHYPIPPHKQKCYKEWNNLSFPITEKIHNEELSIPMSPALKEDSVCYIIDALNQYKE
jgi:dTDP-4-amino-4,6-dideoxygalactose transaminase